MFDSPNDRARILKDLAKANSKKEAQQTDEVDDSGSEGFEGSEGDELMAEVSGEEDLPSEDELDVQSDGGMKRMITFRRRPAGSKARKPAREIISKRCHVPFHAQLKKSNHMQKVRGLPDATSGGTEA